MFSFGCLLRSSRYTSNAQLHGPRGKSQAFKPWEFQSSSEASKPSPLSARRQRAASASPRSRGESEALLFMRVLIRPNTRDEARRAKGGQYAREAESRLRVFACLR